MSWREGLHSFGADERVDFAQIRPTYDAFLADMPAASDFVEFAQEAPALILQRDDDSLKRLPELRPVDGALLEARHRYLDSLLTLDGVPDELLAAMLAARDKVRDKGRDDEHLLRMNEALDAVELAAPTDRISAIGAAFRKVGPHQAFTKAREAHQHAPALISINAHFEGAVRSVIDAHRSPTLHLALVEHQQHGGASLEKSFDTARGGLRTAAYAYSQGSYRFFTYGKWWVGMALIKARVVAPAAAST